MYNTHLDTVRSRDERRHYISTRDDPDQGGGNCISCGDILEHTMNKQLEQLAEQAGLGVKHNGIVLTKNVNAAEALENFAELIVRECAGIAHGSDQPSRDIKEYFKVK